MEDKYPSPNKILATTLASTASTVADAVTGRDATTGCP